MNTQTTQNAAVRTVDGVDLPAAGTWTLDPDHTSVEFVARHMMVTKVRGRFPTVSGTIEIGEEPSESTVVVEVGLADVTTGSADRDAHLRSADFFDVETNPTMTFRSTGIEERPDGRWVLRGDLTLAGVTHPLTLDVEYHGVDVDPWGTPKVQFSATGEIEREEFGLTWNMALESGGMLVSKKARIEIEAQATLAS